MKGHRKMIDEAEMAYREETIKPAIFTLLAAIIAVAAPLGWVNHKVSAEGFKAADVSQYSALAAKVRHDVRQAVAVLEQEASDESVVAETVAPSVKLITPDIAPTNQDEAVAQDPKKLNIELSGIYWNPHDPLVTIDNENYRVGDKVKGFTIAEIRKTEVVFKNAYGDTIVKYFYENLISPKKK